jgi:mRNA interferase MazF
VPVASPQSGLHRQSWARTEEVRAISEQRLIGLPLGSVSAKETDEIRTYLRLMLDL